MINTYAIYIEKLDADYKAAFKKIRDYVHANNMDEIRREEILSEVMDSFLAAQAEGREVSKVTGSDLKVFCEQLCSDTGIKSRIIMVFEMLLPMFQIYSLLCIINILTLISDLSDGKTVDFMTARTKGDLPAYLLGGVIAVVSGMISRAVTKRWIFSEHKKYKAIGMAIRAVTIAVLCGLTVYLFKDSSTEGTYLWVALIVCAVFMTVYFFVTRRSREYRKNNRISFSELAGPSVSISDDIEKLEMKRFEKAENKAQKNSTTLSFEKFLESEEKNCTSWDKRPPFYIVLGLSCTVLSTLFTYFVSGFEGVSDIFVFIALMLALEGLVLYGIYKLTDTGAKARLEWIKSKRDELSKTVS